MRTLFANMPIVVVSFMLIVSPLLGKLWAGDNGFRLVMPVLAALTFIFALANFRRINLRVLRSPAMLLLAAYLAYAAISVTWAYSPNDTVTRWVLQVMLLFTVIFPFTMVEQRGDLVGKLHWCFLISMIINVFYVMTTPPMLEYTGKILGHPGYFYHKQYLGMYAAAAIILALYELCCSGHRRVIAVLTICISFWLLLQSKSKLSLGFVILAPVISGFCLIIAYKLRASLLLVLITPLALFLLASAMIHYFPYRIAQFLTGDPTFTGRAYIWQFIDGHIALKPWLGWGFQSYWGVPNSPILQAPGYVATMPSTHSGYMNVRLETGYLGFGLFMSFVAATFHGLEHMRRRNPIRTWLFVTIGVYAVLVNYLDTVWFVPYDPLWILFIIVAAEGARYSQLRKPVYVRARPPQRVPARLRTASSMR